MSRSEQLQFQCLPADAQRAALWRLALSGLAPEQIAERTGWSTDQIRRAMHPETAPKPPWRGHNGMHMTAQDVRIMS